MPRPRLRSVSAALALGALLAWPTTSAAEASYKETFGYLYISGGRASGSVTFITEDETYASISVTDLCPGNGEWVSAVVQIQKNGDDDELAYINTKGHTCGYGTSRQEFREAYHFDHQAARLRICRYKTGSYTAIACNYSRWYDNPYDD